MNRYGIPKEIENEIRVRDVRCVYCRKVMVPTSSAIRADWATIEHLNHLPPFTYQPHQTADDFAIACGGCNSRRRDKPLEVFVAEQGIADTAAPVIKAYLKRGSGRPAC
jgi:hypothetical protein